MIEMPSKCWSGLSAHKRITWAIHALHHLQKLVENAADFKENILSIAKINDINVKNLANDYSSLCGSTKVLVC
jgi:hypothetical protein